MFRVPKTIRKVSKKRKSRSGKVGKTGIVRLYGKDIEPLRLECFERDGGQCVVCRMILIYEPDSIFQPNAYHMSHKRNKKNHGDVISNVESLCSGCHLVGIHNPKSVPPKR